MNASKTAVLILHANFGNLMATEMLIKIRAGVVACVTLLTRVTSGNSAAKKYQEYPKIFVVGMAIQAAV